VAAIKLRRSIGVWGKRLLKWSFLSRSCGDSFSTGSPWGFAVANGAGVYAD
jgi:hypothetical protein